jgi:hypothetical protein
VDRIKKTTIRFNLENNFDEDIWNAIQKKSDQKKNSYIKYLLSLGLQQEMNIEILEKLSELKNILVEQNLEGYPGKDRTEVSNVRDVSEDELTLQNEIMRETDKTETGNIEIDADVMNFLDSL